jgi:hypothetical protein
MLLVIGSLTACTGGMGTPPTPTAPVTSPSAVSVEPFVRTCDSAVFGSLGKGWMEDALVAGPVFVVGGEFGHLPAGTFDLRPGRAALLKLLLVIHGNEPVTISIPPDVRDAALVYDPDAFNTNRLGSGDRAVTFEPCGGGPQHTQFNGAIAATRSMCLTLNVETADADTIHVRVPFGEPC